MENISSVEMRLPETAIAWRIIGLEVDGRGFVFIVAAEPGAGFVAAFGGAVEPVVEAEEADRRRARRSSRCGR